MKNRNLVKVEGPLQGGAARILRGFPGLVMVAGMPTATARATVPLPAGMVRATLSFAGTDVPVAVEFQPRCTVSMARQLVRRAAAHPHLFPLLITGEATMDARRILEDHGIGLVDGRGHVHIELPGLLLHLECRQCPRHRATAGPPVRLAGKAGVAAQTLLLNRSWSWQVRDLADEAAVSVGLAHRVLTRLVSLDIMTARGGCGI